MKLPLAEKTLETCLPWNLQRIAARLYRISVTLICLIFALSIMAQSSHPKQKANDNGIVGDNGEEADQPVSNSASLNADDVAGTTASAWQMLEDGAKDAKEQTRIDALNAIGTLSGFQRAETTLQNAIKDQNVDVRVAAVAAAGNMQDENLAPILRQALDDTAPEVAYAAAVALWKMHDPSGINVLYSVLAGDRKTKGSFVQTGARQANKDLHDPAALAKIGAEQGAYALLGPFGIGLSAARLMMKSNNANSARVFTANLLAEDHSEQTKAEFIDALGDKDYFVRAASAHILGSFHGKDVSSALVSVFDDSKPSVRFMAAASYIRNSRPVPAAARHRKRRMPSKS